VCSINLAVPSDTSRAGWMMNHVYFVKCVLWPDNVHASGPSGFTDCCWNVLVRQTTNEFTVSGSEKTCKSR